jgi:flavin-dependent dehydrogenase
MPSDSFDCVIVGARCSGAPLARHLANGGMKVCIVDADALPSDQPFSTHAIHAPGMDLLDEVGVGAAVRAGAPPVRVSRLVVGGVVVDVAHPPGREMRCPRRARLDALLQEAATAAGAELRDETTVLGLVKDGERVAGVTVRHGDRTYDIRARVVVGADGRNSTIARLVRAEEYLGAENQRGGYWAYWPVTPAIERLPYQTIIEIDRDDARFLFLTDDGLALAGGIPKIATARTWSDDIEGRLAEYLSRSEVIRALVDGKPPRTRPVGLLKARFFFRVPVGPGWALVGDAGLHKDPMPGLGITDALRDARSLSKALLDGRDAALEVYWRERDVLSMPLFANANAMGALSYDNPFNALVLEHVRRSPVLKERLRAAFERKVSPFEIIPTWRVLAWTARALVGGRTDVLPHFLESAKLGSWVRGGVSRRQKLLGAARRKLRD